MTWRSRLESLLTEEGVTPLKIMVLGNLDLVFSCVIAGMGISLVPKAVVEKREDREQLIIQDIPDKYSKLPILFVWNRNTFVTNALKEFMNISKELFSESSESLGDSSIPSMLI